MGLAVLAILAGYLFICWLMSRLVASIVNSHGGNGKRWGHISLSIMFSMIFWYAIAVEVVFWGCCAIGRDLTIYKTLEEWKRENPGVAETLKPIDNAERIEIGPHHTRYQLNQRFAWDLVYKDKLLNVVEKEERIIDLKTGEIMASFLDYTTSNFSESNTLSWAASVHHYSCKFLGSNNEKRAFNEYYHLLKYQDEIEL